MNPKSQFMQMSLIARWLSIAEFGLILAACVPLAAVDIYLVAWQPKENPQPLLGDLFLWWFVTFSPGLVLMMGGAISQRLQESAWPKRANAISTLALWLAVGWLLWALIVVLKDARTGGPIIFASLIIAFLVTCKITHLMWKPPAEK